MDEVKDKLIGLGIILFIVVGGMSLLFCFFSELFKSFLWLVYVDNAETGLPMWAEILVKVIVETLVIAILTGIGLSQKKPIVKGIVIVAGFCSCFALYWIAEYIIWILVGLLTIVIGYIVYKCIKKHKNKKSKLIVEGDAIND